MAYKAFLTLTLLLALSSSVNNCPLNCLSCTVNNHCKLCFKSDLTSSGQCVPPSVPNCLISSYNSYTKHYSCGLCAQGYASRHIGSSDFGDNDCVKITSTIKNCINYVMVAGKLKCFTCSGSLAPSKNFEVCETPERQFSNCVAYGRTNDDLDLFCSRCGDGYAINVQWLTCLKSPAVGCLNAYVYHGKAICVTCNGFTGYSMRRSGSCSK